MSNEPNRTPNNTPNSDVDNDMDEYLTESMYDDPRDDPNDEATYHLKDLPREAWWNQDYADFHDFRGHIQKLLDETYKALDEAVGYIKRQEDGPLTMRYALAKVRRKLAAVEVEINTLTATNDSNELANEELTRQRNDALYQLTVLSRYVKTQHWGG